jgi:hypothetical protein
VLLGVNRHARQQAGAIKCVAVNHESQKESFRRPCREILCNRLLMEALFEVSLWRNALVIIA